MRPRPGESPCRWSLKGTVDTTLYTRTLHTRLIWKETATTWDEILLWSLCRFLLLQIFSDKSSFFIASYFQFVESRTTQVILVFHLASILERRKSRRRLSFTNRLCAVSLIANSIVCRSRFPLFASLAHTSGRSDSMATSHKIINRFVIPALK